MEVFLVEIPKTNGKEQSGFRPALVLSKPTKDIAIIIPFTSNILGLRFPFTLKINPSLENGLTSTSVLLLFQIRAIDSSRLKKKLGVIDEKTSKVIKNDLSKLLKLS